MKTNSGAALRMLALSLSLALAAGCQSTSGDTASGAGSAPAQQQGGFLGDYSQLQPARDRKGVAIYVDRSVDYRPFTKLMFDPVQVLVAPGPEQQPAQPEAMARVSAILLDSLRRALEPQYQVVTTPGPDVLRVRSAVTGVQLAKPKAGAVDYLPFKAIYNLGREAAGTAPRVAEMTAEMEVLDPAGKRAVAVTASRRGDNKLAQGEEVSWADLQAISDYWASNFRLRLDELRSTAPRQ